MSWPRWKGPSGGQGWSPHTKRGHPVLWVLLVLVVFFVLHLLFAVTVIGASFLAAYLFLAGIWHLFTVSLASAWQHLTHRP